MDHKFEEWYLEYELCQNRPGILGDIASLMGMLQISIVTINGVDLQRRGMLLKAPAADHVHRLEHILRKMEAIAVIKMRRPKLRDRIAIRHGRYIEHDNDDKKTFRFVREDLGVLVDFVAELMKEERHLLIGVRGNPRVGKTESIVAASVCANKRWLFLSSTLMKQTVRTSLFEEEREGDHVYIIDGAVSTRTMDERHRQLIREVMRLPAVKVIEHPDLYVRNTDCVFEDFDYIIELRNNQDEVIIIPQETHRETEWFE